MATAVRVTNADKHIVGGKPDMERMQYNDMISEMRKHEYPMLDGIFV